MNPLARTSSARQKLEGGCQSWRAELEARAAGPGFGVKPQEIEEGRGSEAVPRSGAERLARLSAGGTRTPWLVRWKPYVRVTTVLFCAVHLAALVGVVLCGWSWGWATLAVGIYFARMVVVTAGYHRYFAHRAFKTSRLFQFILALGAQSAAQKGVLWWASHHRFHHRHSDTPDDIHSALHRGFWYSHIGWLFDSSWSETHWELVKDLARFPELRILNRSVVHVLPAVGLALACLAIGGTRGLVWGFFVSTVLLWHGSFSINSLAHLFGTRRFATGDDSRNNWLLAILTNGEGWHNNHHHCQSAANQGIRWWEVDVTYYCLRSLALLGLIWDLRRPSRAVLVVATKCRRRERPTSAAT